MTKFFVRSFITALGVLPGLAFGAAEGHAQLGPNVEVSAFADVYYGYAFNKVDPELRTFDVAHNAFSLGLVELALERVPTAASPVGGRIDLNFGTTADIVGAVEPASDEIYKHVQQAYVSWMPGDNLTLDAGKFVTPIGAEVIESQDNWNYTRSLLFGFAIPFYHTGIRATYAASDELSLSGFLVNGWNNTFETNTDKTFVVQALVTPDDRLAWVANFMVGKEDDFDADGSEDVLWLFDTTVSLALNDMVSVMGNFDYGKATDFVATDEDGSWWGLAGYVRYQARPDWALAGRVEYVDDSEAGFMTIGETAQSYTVTSDHLLGNALIARIEFRMDNVAQGAAPTDFFTKDDGSDSGNQPSLTVGLVYGLN
jgi:hypothetical protein